MFIGHFGVALAAKTAAPRTSLGTLFLAGEFLDAWWPLFLLAGIEHVRIAPGITAVSPLDFYDYPISHSLLTAVFWSAGFAVAYYLLRRYGRRSWVVALVVLSHWFLDVIVHRPDLPLVPGSRRYYGLGLWNSWPASILAEVALFAIGLLIYLRATSARDRAGSYGFWGLMAALIVSWLSSMMAGPPPSLRVLEWSAIALWITVPWAWWADAHRRLANAAADSG